MPSSQRMAAQPLRILLIEDSARLCDMLRDMLNDLDNVEVVATTPDESGALELLKQHEIALAIVDLELRQGSGLGVLEHIKSQPHIYGSPDTVVFSNYGHDILRKRCSALGVRFFFDKSFQLDELLNHVQALADEITT